MEIEKRSKDRNQGTSTARGREEEKNSAKETKKEMLGHRKCATTKGGIVNTKRRKTLLKRGHDHLLQSYCKMKTVNYLSNWS